MHVPEKEPESASALGYASESNSAEPQTRFLCGTVYFCCYMIQCFDEDANVHVEKFSNVPICPAQYGWGKIPTRYIAYYIWQTEWMPGNLKDAKAKYKTQSCYTNESNCHENEGAPRCGNYPEP